MAFNRLSLVKLAELLLVIACVVFHYNSVDSGTDLHTFFISAVFGGYFIIMIGLLLGFFVDTAFGRRTDLYFTVLGGVLFLSAGVMSYNHFSNLVLKNKYGEWKAWAAIVNGIIFFVDAVFTFRSE
jgi:hypothetical protein